MKRFNKKFSGILAVTSIILTSLVVLSFGYAKKEEKEIKIGAILPLTGDAAQWGIPPHKGAELAVQEINQSKFWFIRI